MLTPEEIQAERERQRLAIFNRFENKDEVAPQPANTQPNSNDIEKSESSVMYWTDESLVKFKEDLFKAIDNGSITGEELEKAQDSILSLVAVEKEINGVPTRVYVKEDTLEKGVTGEGSRGGHIIGHTKSGKPIYQNFNHPEHKSFTSQDHEDAREAQDVHGKKLYEQHQANSEAQTKAYEEYLGGKKKTDNNFKTFNRTEQGKSLAEKRKASYKAWTDNNQQGYSHTGAARDKEKQEAGEFVPKKTNLTKDPDRVDSMEGELRDAGLKEGKHFDLHIARGDDYAHAATAHSKEAHDIISKYKGGKADKTY